MTVSLYNVYTFSYTNTDIECTMQYEVTFFVFGFECTRSLMVFGSVLIMGYVQYFVFSVQHLSVMISTIKGKLLKDYLSRPCFWRIKTVLKISIFLRFIISNTNKLISYELIDYENCTYICVLFTLWKLFMFNHSMVVFHRGTYYTYLDWIYFGRSNHHL